MELSVISLAVLAICEPLLLDAKKVVVVMPRKVRRSHSSPWHQLFMHAKKNGHPGQNFPGQRHDFTRTSPFYRPKGATFANDRYPQGGDDFDQGHEEVNHVVVPHGKGITHAVSFGNGYIPFDNHKHRPSVSHRHNYNTGDPKDVAYGPTANVPVAPVYSQAYLSQQADSYIGNEDYNDQSELQDRSHDRAAQGFANGRAFPDFTKAPSIGTRHFGGVGGVTIAQPESPVPTFGTPSATIGRSKQGFVVRDSVAFDDYNREVMELMKTWPGNLGNNNFLAGAIGDHRGIREFDELARQYDGNGLTGAGYSGGSTLAASLSRNQGRTGYAVKEDIVDTAPDDFRTIPLQTPPVVQPLAIQIPQQAIRTMIQPSQQSILQQPAQHTLQHFFPQSQVSLNYAMPNFQVHG